jgi:TIR domain-containing protein
LEHFKVFLAHSSKDGVLTDNIHHWLLTHSYIDYVWIDKIELKAGDYLRNKIDKGIESSDFLLPIITPNSIKSKWVNYEVRKAFEKESDLNIKFILPILKDCKIPRYLKHKIYVNVDDKLHGIDQIIPGMLKDYHILEIDLDSKSFEIKEEKFIKELNEFLLIENKPLCYVKINTYLFEILPRFINKKLSSYRKQFNQGYEDEFTKAHLFKQQLQTLWHNLSYIISELVHHIVINKRNGSFTVQIISAAVKNIIMNVHSYCSTNYRYNFDWFPYARKFCY